MTAPGAPVLSKKIRRGRLHKLSRTAGVSKSRSGRTSGPGPLPRLSTCRLCRAPFRPRHPHATGEGIYCNDCDTHLLDAPLWYRLTILALLGRIERLEGRKR